MSFQKPNSAKIDFNKTPFLVIWEVTRSCLLACQHCRANAESGRNPYELSTKEGKRLIDEVANMGTPILIFSGGDPLQRDDLETLIQYAKGLNLRVGTIPAATSLLTQERVFSLKSAGLDQLALSLDASTSDRHDAFRQVHGSFEKTLQAAEWAGQAGIALQINTVFGKWNKDDFMAIASLIDQLGIVFWEVFFLVPTGRGAALEGCTAQEYEELFSEIYKKQKEASYIIKVTEAQHYRRYVVTHQDQIRKRLYRSEGPKKSIGMAPKGVNAGKGFCFIDHIGNIYPSGFLPITVSNVRKESLCNIYQNHPIFKVLRDSSRLKGRCGACEYRDLCGGSRARAYALTGDYMAEDPICNYAPNL